MNHQMMNQGIELTDEYLRRIVPSAYAIQPYHAQSVKYAFIPTSDVITGMRQNGFVPVKASQSRTRIEGKQDFTKHMIRFRSINDSNRAAVVGDSVVESILVNAHDGTSAYKLFCGVFRFTCANGMAVSDGTFGSISIRHIGNIVESVIEATRSIIAGAPKVLDTVKNWMSLQLTAGEQHAFAQAALVAHYGMNEETKQPETELLASDLLRVRRSADSGTDLWHTLNRVQENTMLGTKTYRYGANGRRISSRKVTGIDTDVKLNRALWTLAEELAKSKQ